MMSSRLLSSDRLPMSRKEKVRSQRNTRALSGQVGSCPAAGSLSQERLQFRKSHLDRVQVGRIARQETQFGALGLDRFPDFRALVRGEIVDQDDVSRRERWSKHFFDISEETFAIDRAIEDEGGGDAIMRSAATKVVVFQCPCGTLA